ncbi:hypothetical protein SSS_04651, partial [Sarcoptes scabiei]
FYSTNLFFQAKKIKMINFAKQIIRFDASVVIVSLMILSFCNGIRRPNQDITTLSPLVSALSSSSSSPPPPPSSLGSSPISALLPSLMETYLVANYSATDLTDEPISTVSFPTSLSLPNSLNDWNESIQQILSTTNLSQIIPSNLISNNLDLVSNLTQQLESLQNNVLINLLYNTSRSSMNVGSALFTESVARPATFFLGQNLRLLGNGLSSLGQSLKYSGYHISNLEPAIQNASNALSEYGINLINSSINGNE